MKSWQVPRSTSHAPIRYWQAIREGQIVAEHVSIALLKHRYGKFCTYNPIR